MPFYDVSPIELNEKVAEELKKIETIKPPVWSAFVKTGAHKERPPADTEGWWFMRAAAVLRSVATLGPVGVSKLRTKYGGKRRRGMAYPEFRRGSGSVLRKVLQQLDKAGLTKFKEKGVHKGRVVTPKGMSLLDKTAIMIIKSKPKEKIVEEPKPEVKKESPKPEVEKKLPAEKPETMPVKEVPAEKKLPVQKPKEEPKKEAPKPEVKKEETKKEEKK